MAEDKKDQSIFKAMGELFKAKMEESLLKARSTIAQEEDTAVYQKSVQRDFTFATGASGYHEKLTGITFEHQKQMSRKNTIVAGIIKTRQNQAAIFSKPVNQKHEAGFKISLKDEASKLEQIIQDIKDGKIDNSSKNLIQNSNNISKSMRSKLRKAEVDVQEYLDDMNDKDLKRLAEEILKVSTKEKIKEITQIITNCGKQKDRPFESRKWNFDSMLRALVSDSLSYDWIAVEKVPESNNPDKVHYFVPVDSSTIRYAAPSLSNAASQNFQASGNILYPEKELEAMQEDRDTLELDPEKVENGDYKYVQRIRGLIVRAYVPEELAVGMRNPLTDIYANGYSVSELELLASTVTSHLNTENYKRTYFTNGFSAKGILHIKAPLNRRKLEALRIQWKHMVSGPKNSFQTPIFAGMDEVQWIPLNQGNIDQEFNNWMQYLIKVICMIYQIDPSEIGFGMKEEGSGSAGMSGDSTQEKIVHSKSKGLIPLMKFIENFINVNIIDFIDSEYRLEFVGLSEEDSKQSIERQASEVKYKKSVNEIRAEDGLPPIPGCDELILDPTYFQWYSQFSEEGKKNMQEMQESQQQGALDDQIGQDASDVDQEAMSEEGAIGDQIGQDVNAEEGSQNEENQVVMEAATRAEEDEEENPMKKSLSIEYYTFPSED